MVCRSCGKQIPDGSVRCPYCGVSLTAQASPQRSSMNPQMNGYYQNPNYVEQPSGSNMPEGGGAGLSIASMVCGICSLVFFCVFYLGFILGLVGVILGGVALKKKNRGRGMAIAGVVTSIIALALSVLVLVGYGSLAGMGLASRWM